MRYDADVPPQAEAWLELSEDEQIQIVERYHERLRVDLPADRRMLHAMIHATVETQLAMQLPAVVDALARLQADGMNRHEALHAVGSVLVDHMHGLMVEERAPTDPNASYSEALHGLTAKSWREAWEEEDDEDEE